MTKYYKYPRTPHLPWSEGATNDDRRMDTKPFVGKHIVVTVKMDGENTTMYKDHVHARSIDSNRSHPSRDWMKNFHSRIAYQIEDGTRICGENMYAEHTLHYDNLEDYFLVHSVWDYDWCESWSTTKLIARDMGLSLVPEIFHGYIDTEKEFKWYINEWNRWVRENNHEGYVIRHDKVFHIDDFSENVGKYVREEFKNSMSDDDHWFDKPIIKNELKDG